MVGPQRCASIQPTYITCVGDEGGIACLSPAGVDGTCRATKHRMLPVISRSYVRRWEELGQVRALSLARLPLPRIVSPSSKRSALITIGLDHVSPPRRLSSSLKGETQAHQLHDTDPIKSRFRMTTSLAPPSARRPDLGTRMPSVLSHTCWAEFKAEAVSAYHLLP